LKNAIRYTVGVTAASIALAATLGAGLAGAAPVNSHHGHKGPATLTGTTTCTVSNVRLHFSAALTGTATTAATDVRLTGNVLKHCADSTTGQLRIRNGHLRGLLGSIPAGATCTSFLTGGVLPAFGTGTTRWTPTAKIAPTTGISFPAGTLTPTTSATPQLALAFSGGTASGSFATTAAALTATSRASVADLTAACASSTGIDGIGFRAGSITL
jgi:hypothetical protein